MQSRVIQSILQTFNIICQRVWGLVADTLVCFSVRTSNGAVLCYCDVVMNVLISMKALFVVFPSSFCGVGGGGGGKGGGVQSDVR